MNTENAPIRNREYINNIKTPGFFGGELELSTEIELYNINIQHMKKLIIIFKLMDYLF